MLAEAERKMGQMLKETKRSTGGNPNLPTSSRTLEVGPTLKELGLTHTESAKAQKSADIPQEKFDGVKTGKTRRIRKGPHDT